MSLRITFGNNNSNQDSLKANGQVIYQKNNCVIESDNNILHYPIGKSKLYIYGRVVGVKSSESNLAEISSNLAQELSKCLTLASVKALIKKIESCKWNDMTYIGDNPYKDFVNLNPLGVNTIRLINGSYRNVKLDKKYEANYKINSLAEIFKII